MSSYVAHVSYDQGMSPNCTLKAITMAAWEACKRDKILANFDVLESKLQEWALRNDSVLDGLSESENDEDVKGIGKGFEPTEFNSAKIKHLINCKNGETCFLTIFVSRIGIEVENKKHFSSLPKPAIVQKFDLNKEYVVVVESDSIPHTMYVTWLVSEGNGYYLCRNSEDFGLKNGERYKTIPLDELKHELYEVKVHVKRRIGGKRKIMAQTSFVRKNVRFGREES